MTIKTTAYLSFKDNARQAMDFYKGIFGGQLEAISMSEVMPDGPADLVGHAWLQAEHLELMASDTPPGTEFGGLAGFSLGLHGDDEATIRRYWDALGEGGEVTLPLEKAPWGDHFGMVTDRFGVSWGINIAGSTD